MTSIFREELTGEAEVTEGERAAAEDAAAAGACTRPLLSSA
jgi:hypothetical protein